MVANDILTAADVSERVASELVNLPSDLMQQISNEVIIQHTIFVVEWVDLMQAAKVGNLFSV